MQVMLGHVFMDKYNNITMADKYPHISFMGVPRAPCAAGVWFGLQFSNPATFRIFLMSLGYNIMILLFG